MALVQPAQPRRRSSPKLRGHYGSIDAFNRSWHLSVASWDELVKHAPSLPDTLSSEAQDDLKTFSAALAERYFSTVKAAISKEDPHHLYLGSRFAAITPEALAACARYCDVVSVNLYTTHMDLGRLDGVDKPVLISEFSFGAQDRGSFSGGLIDVGSEANVADATAASCWPQPTTRAWSEPTGLNTWMNQPAVDAWTARTATLS